MNLLAFESEIAGSDARQPVAVVRLGRSASSRGRGFMRRLVLLVTFASLGPSASLPAQVPSPTAVAPQGSRFALEALSDTKPTLPAPPAPDSWSAVRSAAVIAVSAPAGRAVVRDGAGELVLVSEGEQRPELGIRILEVLPDRLIVELLPRADASRLPNEPALRAWWLLSPTVANSSRLVVLDPRAPDSAEAVAPERVEVSATLPPGAKRMEMQANGQAREVAAPRGDQP